MPSSSPASNRPDAQAWRALALRRLQPHPLSAKGRTLKVTAFIDGASRGNPGPSGYGALLRSDAGWTLRIRGFLGTTTNNVAEYAALLDALAAAYEHGADEIEIVSDSQLLVRQIGGEYRVRHPNLVPMHRKAMGLLSKFRKSTVRHVLRQENRDADRLANEAIDRGETRSAEREEMPAE